MRKKKIVALIVVALLLVIGAVVAIVCIVKKGKDTELKEGDFTRYEWIKLLCEKVGVTDYESEISYFEDVTKGNEYFNYLQSAVEWEVLEDDKKFNGEYGATGEFIAMTAIKTISKEKMEIYLESE